LNGFGYALFGVPERDLTKTWTNHNIINTIPGQSPLLTKADDVVRKNATFAKFVESIIHTTFVILILRNIEFDD